MITHKLYFISQLLLPWSVLISNPEHGPQLAKTVSSCAGNTLADSSITLHMLHHGLIHKRLVRHRQQYTRRNCLHFRQSYSRYTSV